MRKTSRGRSRELPTTRVASPALRVTSLLTARLEVLMRLKRHDTYMRAGTYPRKPPLPYTPGSDGAGVVEAVGEGVKKVKRGDRVYTTQTLSGAYAEYALALEHEAHPLPSTISSSKGAAVCVHY